MPNHRRTRTKGSEVPVDRPRAESRSDTGPRRQGQGHARRDRPDARHARPQSIPGTFGTVRSRGATRTAGSHVETWRGTIRRSEPEHGRAGRAPTQTGRSQGETVSAAAAERVLVVP